MLPDSDLARLRKYALPDIGLLPLAELKPRHVRDLVRKLKTGSLAPRTILSIFWTLHEIYEEAQVDELVTANPVIVKPGVLPKKRDKDPTWRSLATEVMQLITDPRIPVERRMCYAFKAIAGMRHGEVAALAIQQIDFTASPLPRINVARAFSPASGEIKTTKTEDPRCRCSLPAGAHDRVARALARDLRPCAATGRPACALPAR